MSKTRKARAFLKLDPNRHVKGAAKAMFLGQPRAMVGSFSSSSSPSLSLAATAEGPFFTGEEEEDPFFLSSSPPAAR